MWSAARAPNPADIAPDPRLPNTDARIRYPDSRAPYLAAPDGSRRIVRSLLNVDRPMAYGDFLWDERGVGAGATWVQVDLARQLISVFRDGEEIGSAVVLYGTDGKPTPSGVFPIMEKDRDHVSSLYDTQMPFMLRLTGDGVAIHASSVRRGAATHGCIGVPPAFAAKLFAAVARGDTVVVLPATASISA
ncbi:L,D-transpeptidase family protein [Sphingomonas sp. MMS24-JH45]